MPDKFNTWCFPWDAEFHAQNFAHQSPTCARTELLLVVSHSWNKHVDVWAATTEREVAVLASDELNRFEFERHSGSWQAGGWLVSRNRGALTFLCRSELNTDMMLRCVFRVILQQSSLVDPGTRKGLLTGFPSALLGGHRSASSKWLDIY